MKRLIARLEAQVDEEARHPSPVPEKRLRPEDLLRQRRIRDLRADLDAIDRQLASGQRDEAALRSQITDLQGKVDVVPTRESELVELTRDYKTIQDTYSNLLAKLEDSRVAANLERRQIGEQFRILDEAALPERPHNQRQRVGVLGGGIFGGLLVGLAVVAFLEYSDSTFKSEQEILRVLSLPVLALVPVIASPAPVCGSRWRPSRTSVGRGPA